MKKFLLCVLAVFLVTLPVQAGEDKTASYKVGVGDILSISVLQPQELSLVSTVAPDGTINFPYIGLVTVQGLDLAQVQDIIQQRLSEGYMRYPVVSVILQESRSLKFFVYGEVQKPGTYPLDSKTTVLKAISMAGGLTKFGASNSVRILREKDNEPGYATIKVNLKAVMGGVTQEDILIKAGDIIVISEAGF